MIGSENTYSEAPLIFTIKRQPDMSLLAICSVPSEPRTCGVLILVGGPQYRAGSHRQFVLLARALAAEGYPVMRFDFSGMGDSTGPDRGFENRNEEVRAAIDAFMAQVPGLQGVVLWGLCDGASGALFYAAEDQRVLGLTLLNPWVRSTAGLAKTHLKHYYGARLREPDFWRKLLSGRMNLAAAVGGWFGALLRSRDRTVDTSLRFQQRMAAGWRQFKAPILLIVSVTDMTAQEFLDHAATDPAWQGLLESEWITRRDFAEADHTFSSAVWRDQVARWTGEWIAYSVKQSR